MTSDTISRTMQKGYLSCIYQLMKLVNRLLYQRALALDFVRRADWDEFSKVIHKEPKVLMTKVHQTISGRMYHVDKNNGYLNSSEMKAVEGIWEELTYMDRNFLPPPDPEELPD